MDSKILVAFASGCVITYSALKIGDERLGYPISTALTLHFLLFILGVLVGRTLLNESKDFFAGWWNTGTESNSQLAKGVSEMLSHFTSGSLDNSKRAIKLRRPTKPEDEPSSSESAGLTQVSDRGQSKDVDKLAEDL